jgi:WD40 repeat protein
MSRSLILGLMVLYLTNRPHLARCSGAAAPPVRPAPPQLVRIFPSRAPLPVGILFSPDGQLLAVNSGKTIRLWVVRSGQCRWTLQAPAQQMAFSSDSRLLATIPGKNTVILWDLGARRQKRLLPVRSRYLSSLSFSPDGRTLAVADYSANQVLLYETRTWRRKGRLKGDPPPFKPHPDARWYGGITAVKFSPDGRYLATAHDEMTVIAIGQSHAWIKLWDTATWRPQMKLRPKGILAPSCSLDAFAFSPDSQHLIGIAFGITDGENFTGSQMTHWDVQSGQAQTWGRDFAHRGTALAYAAGGKVLVVGSPDKGIWLLDGARPETGVIKPSLDEKTAVPPLAVSTDGQFLATASPGGPVKLWAIRGHLRQRVLAQLRSQTP